MTSSSSSHSPDNVFPVQRRLGPLLTVLIVTCAVLFAVRFLRPFDVDQPHAVGNPIARVTNTPEKFQTTLSAASLSGSGNVTVADETKTEENPGRESVSSEKRKLLQEIATDYDELSQPIYTAVTGVIPREDREKLTLIDQEKIADLASVLTPAELDAYHYLTSKSVPLRRR